MENDNNLLGTWQVKAGRRNYFFDVKATKGQDLYMTITESKRVSHDDEEPRYQKHKIFLYKEDFEGFMEAFQGALGYLLEKQGKDGYKGPETIRVSRNQEISAKDSLV